MEMIKFKDEEEKSEYGYLSGYKPKGITEQTNRLRELFPGVGYVNQELLGKIEKGEVKLPKKAEGWFTIPNWLKNPKIFGANYNEAVVKVLDLINKTRDGKFYNYREDQLGPEHLRQAARTAKFWEMLRYEQEDQDILIVPAQFGFLHRGRSVRRVREVMQSKEFGLGAFAIAIMLLTHPERLNHIDDLYMDCVGDEYDDPNFVDRFEDAPYFYFGEDGVRFGARWFGDTGGGYGSASGFLLK